MIVTELRKRRHRLTAVILDDGEPVPVDTETLLTAGIAVGSSLTPEQWEELIALSQSNRAYEKALYLLEYRAHSRKELADKLRREYGEELALQTVEKMDVLGLTDDESFARDYARELLTVRQYGVHRVRSELLRKGIDKELVEQILAEQEEDPVERLAQLIGKKYRPLPTDPKGMQKIMAAMVRRGYEFSDVRQALTRLTDEEIEEEESWP